MFGIPEVFIWLSFLILYLLLIVILDKKLFRRIIDKGDIPSIHLIIILIFLSTSVYFSLFSYDAYLALFNFFFKETTPHQRLAIIAICAVTIIVIWSYFDKKPSIRASFIFLFLIFMALLVSTAIHHFGIISEVRWTVPVDNHYFNLNCTNHEYLDLVQGTNLNCSGQIENIDGFTIKQIEVLLNKENKSYYNSTPIDKSSGAFSLLIPVKNTTNLDIRITVAPIINKSEGDPQTWNGFVPPDQLPYEFYTQKEYDERFYNRLIFVAGFFITVITVIHYSKDLILSNKTKEEKEKLIICTQCGKTNEKNAMYCNKCASRLRPIRRR